MESWVIPLLGGLGIGSLITTIVTKIVDRLNAKKALLYKEKREVYLGVLDVIHKVGVDPSQENNIQLAVWKSKVDLFAAQKIQDTIQSIINAPPYSAERSNLLTNLKIQMKNDLNKQM